MNWNDLDFECQAQVEKNYFKGKSKQYANYKAYCEWTDTLKGYQNPMDYISLTDKETTIVLNDYSCIQREKSFNQENFCKDMLKSKVAYDWYQDETGVELVSKNPSYLYKYIMIFGFETVAKWAQELIDTVDHIDHNVYTDCEGCTYNSIVYKKGGDIDG